MRLSVLALCVCLSIQSLAQGVEHVLHISVDGLRGDAIALLGPEKTPNFHRLRREGSFTDNARTDADFTNTLPNHTCQLTGRPVLSDDQHLGHHWKQNKDPSTPQENLHRNRGHYVPGVYNVAHNAGLSTALYAGKSKFILYTRSWGPVYGQPSTNTSTKTISTNKIDDALIESSMQALLDHCLSYLESNAPAYTFLHLRGPDSVGHSKGWITEEGSEWMKEVIAIDAMLGRLLDTIDHSPALKNKTAIILTADHGGHEKGHGDATSAHNYVIPFYAWGPGIAPGQDLYALNKTTRRDPGDQRILLNDAHQPIRNGEAANLCLQLLGLPAIEQSTFNAQQNLKLTP